MRRFLVPMLILATTTAGYLIGQRQAYDDTRWDNVIVIDAAGTLVANPAALSPEELAAATVIDPKAHITLVKCGSRWEVNANCENWKEIKHVR